MEFLTALGAIVILDLVLAGDNAVVIGLAVRNLEHSIRKKAILWGTIGAVVIRILMTLVAVYLLTIPYLHALGGVLLLPIAVHLLKPTEPHAQHIDASSHFMSAIKTIIVADAAMGIDNVLAIAGASHGHFLLVILGLLISIPIVAFGSSFIADLMDKYPILIVIGAVILAHTSGHMIVSDHKVSAIFAAYFPILNWLLPYLTMLFIIIVALYYRNKKKTSTSSKN